MQKKTLDIMHRGYSSYLEVKNDDSDGSKLQRALLRTDKNGENSDTVLSTCEIDTDWLEKIEKAMPFIERAVKENRQFILRQGETVPIEKVKRVSKTSVEHLARHSQMITREPQPGEDMIPEKILMTENVGTYAVYENRFLYMLLCYIKDFAEIKYTKIRENAYLFSTETEINKTISDKSKKISFSLKYKEVSADVVPEDVAKQTTEGLKRIKTVIEEAEALLKTGLMVEVSTAPMLKPPITRTNVLIQNTCFAAALDLYDYLAAYRGAGYTTKELFRQNGALSENARADYAELAALTSYVSYRNGGMYEQMEESRREFLQESAEKARKERDRRINELKQALGDISPAVCEYIITLEEKCGDSEAQIQQLKDGRDRLAEAERLVEEASKMRADAKEEAENARTELRRKEQELLYNAEQRIREQGLAEVTLKQKEDELKKAYANHKEEIEKLTLEFKEEYSNLAEKYHLQSALLRGKNLADGKNQESKEMTKEEFIRLEAEYNAFKKYFEACWRETKKNIRREKLWKK